METDYDKLLSDFLASDKSEQYKNSILSLLNTDYSRFTNDKVNINKNLALRLNEIKFKDFKLAELRELAKNLWLTRYSNISKQALVEKIELVKSNFCNVK